MLYSPLRYPGGKNKLSAFIAKICIDNNINGHYVEPYAGGASIALFLLIEGFVDKITINDHDRSIYAFWHSVLNKTNKLCEKIENVELTIEEWKKQRKIQMNKSNVDLLELGFSTFYMNRTNYSGIINAGVMGGNEQSGKHLIDCRFNKTELINRIQRIAKKKKHIRLYKKDALKLIDKIQNESEDQNTIFYFDPPYYLKAKSLYMNHYKDKDHRIVSEKIKSIQNIQWVISYDNVSAIKDLYHDFSYKEFSFKHTAYKIREGKEILFFSKNLIKPEVNNWNPLFFKLRKNDNNHRIVYY